MALRINSGADLIDWGEQTFLDNVTLMTCSFWVRPDFGDWSAFQPIIGNTSSILADGFSIGRGSSTNIGIAVEGVVQVEPLLSDTIFTHVHIVWDGKQPNATRVRTWYNGVLQTPASVPTWAATTIPTHTANLLVGSIHGVLVDAALAEINLWANAAITQSGPITTIMNGCGHLIAPRALQLDVGMLAEPPDGPIDRSQNALVGDVSGTLNLEDHPAGTQSRNTCPLTAKQSGGGYFTASYHGLVEPPSGW